MAYLRSAEGLTSHRFFVPSNAIYPDRVAFSTDQAKQISRVLRLRVGDEVVVFGGTGTESVVQLTEVGRHVTGTVLSSRHNTAEPALHLTLYQGLLKGTKLDLVLQKCTEIGVSRFVPVQTARTVRGPSSEARQGRFDAIVREAAEQSGRGIVPRVLPPVTFDEALAAAGGEGTALLAWEEEGAADLSGVTDLSGARMASLFIGPEGGFTAEEASTARSAGVRVVSLGPRILRAETAAIVGAALVLAQAGEMARPASP